MLEFEKPVLELEAKIAELRKSSGVDHAGIADEIDRMQKKAEKLLVQIYSKLTPAQKVQVARHPNRPHYLDYIKGMITDFTPLAGDRRYGEDQALIGGLGRFQGRSVVIMGQERGHDTETRLQHNFGMAKPEGYRKAQRLMEMASQFKLPVLSLVDTSGAYPGIEAEERGQAEAIAKSIDVCLRTDVPFISTIIGEGGSGGAIAIATADRVYMLEHAIYSVISPEGCASILWRSAAHAADAAAALKITAEDLLALKLIDGVIEEPMGGAHRKKEEMIARVERQIAKGLTDLQGLTGAQLLSSRRAKYLAMGQAA
ncbi:MAG: acetyl-CoA carboxylase carboxyltransferase subunit alpha [Pseudomonadota bacterium]